MDDTDLSWQYPSTSKKKKPNEEVPEMVWLMEERTQAVRRPDNQDQTTGMLDDKSLYSIARDIHAWEWKELAIRLGFTQPEVSHIEADYRHSVLEQIYNMLVSWRERRPGENVSHLHKALEEVRQRQECSTSDVQSQAAAAKCKDALKLHYRTTGSYVQLNPYEVDKKRIPDIYTRLQLANAKGDLEGTLGSYEDILVLKTREGDLIKIAVLSGLAGRGKSTLFDKIAYDWAVDCGQALQKYELVFLLKMSYLEQASDLIDAVFDQLIAENIAKHIDKGALQSYIEKNADKVLILLDGFDELKTTSLSESSFGSILKLLSRKSYRGCTVLVSTRPSHYDRLVTKELVQQPFTHVRVLGFDKDSIEEYVQRYYSDEPDKAKGLLERIGSSDNLSTLAESPMLLLLMCLLWREDSTLPETMSRLYQNAIDYIAKRKKVSEEEMSRVVVALGKVGLRGLLSPDQELTFKESDFEQSVLDIALKVGILTRQRVCKRLKPYNSVQFIHKTFQEFCAGAYLQKMLQANTEEFHDTLNEIMSEDPLDFEYLLRFCCGDNEACTLEILKVFQERRQKYLSFGSCVGQLALHCYFEGQCKCLPPEEVMHSFLTDQIYVLDPNNDSKNSIKYFVEQIKDSGNADVSELVIRASPEYVENAVEAFSGLPNLVTLHLAGNLGGTAALWCKQLGQYRALQYLNLKRCSLNGQDMVHVAKSLRGLPKLVTLILFQHKLGGTAESWCKKLGKCKALQNLQLSDCELNGQDMVHVAESLRGLPKLVALILFRNDLGGTAESWCKQLGQFKALKMLDLSGCSLNGQGTVHIVESLRGLPNLVTLNLSRNNLRGTAALWCKQLGQCKALQDLDLSGCKLNGQDMVHVAKSLRGLPNLVTLNLFWNDHIGRRKAESWCKQLGQCKALQDLNLERCSLNGQDMVHIAESLRGLPNLVTLNLSWNDHIGGRKAESWCKQLGQCKALQDLNLERCSLNGQDMVHVAESLRGLPNLVTLNLCKNDLGGTAALWCKQLGQCKALQDLNLSDCSLNGQDMVHVAKSLRGLPNLVTLDLCKNDLGGTAESWCKQLGQCITLQQLDLCLCSLNEQDRKHVVVSLRGLPNLARLIFPPCDLPSCIAPSLVSACC